MKGCLNLHGDISFAFRTVLHKSGFFLKIHSRVLSFHFLDELIFFSPEFMYPLLKTFTVNWVIFIITPRTQSGISIFRRLTAILKRRLARNRHNLVRHQGRQWSYQLKHQFCRPKYLTPEPNHLL